MTRAERRELNKAAGPGGHYYGPKGRWVMDKEGVDLYGRKALNALEAAANDMQVEIETWDSGRRGPIMAFERAEEAIRKAFAL